MVAALVWMAGVAMAWGQAKTPSYVEGDLYKSVKCQNVRVSLPDNVTHGATEGEINDIYDNNTSTYWRVEEPKVDTNNQLSIILNFNEVKTFSALRIVWGGGTYSTAQEITIQSSNNNADWENVGTYKNEGYTKTNEFRFEEDEISAQYIQLILTPQDNQGGNYKDFITIHEIDFLQSIQHKPAKWHTERAGRDFDDTFSDGIEWYGPEPGFVAEKLQATHTMMDTIYMHPGTSIQLQIPDYLNNETSSMTYQRWYSLRTGKTFATTEPGATVSDILTPVANNLFYRFANGYVGNPLTSGDNPNLYKMNFYMPTSTEFTDWFGSNTGFDNRWYVVACDVSCYTDYGTTGNFTDDYTEPTLSHRIIYYIQAVDANDDTNWYNRAWKNQSDDEFIEEYEINMPFTRYPDTNGTNDLYELVALSKDARSYADPKDEEAPSEVELTVSLGSNTAEIDLKPQKTNSNGQYILKGTDRAIFFDYPVSNTQEGTKSVKEDVVNPMAEIIVKKGSKNLVKFTLNFTKGTSLMTQSMIEKLNDPDEDLSGKSWGAYRERTPQYMEKNLVFLTGLDFNYDKTLAHTSDNGNFYPYPLGWDDCSYGFYDGSNDISSSNANRIPEWGYYSITDVYLENSGWTGGVKGNVPPSTCMESRSERENTFHMFIDASDRPGVIARLPFGEGVTLCPGTELFVSAWVKSAKWGKSSYNAAMLFTFMGVTEDGKYEPLYRHQTGQIPATYMSNIKNMPGFGGNANEWFQLAFSFITDDDIITKYKSYVLQVENNSASTNGGDMYLDDVRIYMAKPQAEVKQLEAICGTERTRLNFSIGWEQLLSRTGEPDLDLGETSLETFPNDGNGAYSAIGICFVDRREYDRLIAEGKSKAEAIAVARVKIGSNIQEGTETNYFDYAAMFYRLSYDSNTDYDEKAADGTGFGQGALAMNNGWFFYRKEDASQRTLAVDFYAELQPYRPYTMVVVPLKPGESAETPDIKDIRDALTAANFEDIDTDCAIQSEVWVTSESLIKVNGSVLNPDLTYCAGQILNFAVQLQAPNEEGEMENIEQEVYYDWFFDKEIVVGDEVYSEYEVENATYNVSLADALTAFRNEYPDATSLDGVIEKGELKQAHINLIQYYLDEKSTNGINSQLVLHRENLNIQLPDNGLSLVVCPIVVHLEEAGVRVCTDPVFLELKTSGSSPIAHVGFSDVNYDGTTEEPNVRIGLTQIKKANGEDEGSRSLKIDLRNISLVGQNGTLGKMDSNPCVYLVGSTDPNLKDRFNEIDSDPLSLPIGYLHEFSANKDGGSIRISFDLNGTLTGAENNDFQFDPKEGYEYSLRVYFQESGGDSQGIASLCEGILTFTMKVVPEYMHWTGLATDNWNHDENWVRSKADDINNPDKYSDYSTPYEHKGFVPMRFTKVVIPTEHKQIELYKATASNRILDLSADCPASITQDATPLIEYDMMVRSADGSNSEYDFDCEPYYTNTVSEIHFEPTTEMLHAELLDYQKAWVDYELTKGRWYTLASPLQGVVAGDFYTDESGTEGAPYFSDITFDDNRLEPAVYQRAWKGETTEVPLYTGASTKRDVAISGNWSSVYNDVTVPYAPGSGFSLKVQEVDKAVFRLPKSDNTYYYYDKTAGKDDDAGKTISRGDNVGELKSDELKTSATGFSVSLDESAYGDYYLVGNPFMAHLDAEAFFTANTAVLESKYWLVTDNLQDVAVGNESGWVTVNENNKPLIAPLQSFFVQKTKDATGDDVTFTKDMQVLGGTDDNLRSTDVLYLTATTRDGRQSHAAISYDPAASETYKASEDAELFLDSNLGDLPMVYTAAGTMAASINRTSGLYNIPVGVYAPGAKGETVSLTFSGVDGFSYATLYDAETRTESPIHEGSSFTVPANTAGRYFLRAGVPTANEAVQESAIRIYTVGGGTLVVASTDLLRTVRVYDFAGRLVANETGLRTTQCRIELPEGSYIVKAESEREEEEVKIRM